MAKIASVLVLFCATLQLINEVNPQVGPVHVHRLLFIQHDEQDQLDDHQIKHKKNGKKGERLKILI